MKLKKSTWFLLFLAISLGGWVYFYELRLDAEKIAVENQQKKIFDFDIKNISQIIITRPVEISPEWQSLTLSQTQDTNTSFWKMEQPEVAPVNQGVIAFLLNLIEQGTTERKLLITQEQLSQYGLDRPIASIKIQLTNGQTHIILLGKETINSNLIYALVNPTDKDDTTTEALLISKNWHYAVMRELKEWQDFSE